MPSGSKTKPKVNKKSGVKLASPMVNATQADMRLPDWSRSILCLPTMEKIIASDPVTAETKIACSSVIYTSSTARVSSKGPIVPIRSAILVKVLIFFMIPFYHHKTAFCRRFYALGCRTPKLYLYYHGYYHRAPFRTLIQELADFVAKLLFYILEICRMHVLSDVFYNLFGAASSFVEQVT